METDTSTPVAASPRKPTKGEITRGNILKAAETSFAELGYDAARIAGLQEQAII